MRNFFAQVAAMIAGFTRMVWTTVIVAGRAIRRLVADPTQSRPALSPIQAANQEPIDDLARFLAVREIAQGVLRGQAPDASVMAMVDEQVDVWMEAMDAPMLMRIASASPAAIRQHMRGQTSLSGVLRYEREAINDYMRARSRRSGTLPEMDPAQVMILAA